MADTEQERGDEVPQRKRGRPRKLVVEQPEETKPKRPRGRPRGSRNKTAPTTRQKQREEPTKRGRGRPKKWVDASKPCAVTSEPESEDVDQEDEDT